MGLAVFPQEFDGISPWQALKDQVKRSDSIAISTTTSTTSVSPSPSSDDDELSAFDQNMTWNGPLLRLTYCFFSNPSNTTCADCRAKLFMDGACNIFVSHHSNDFRAKSCRKNGKETKPNTNCRHLAMEFAVFICVDCARAHRTLAPDVTKLKALTDPNETWSIEEMRWLEAHSGNDRMNFMLERFIPKDYSLNVHTHNVTTQDREVYIRAKYEALAFLFPGTLKGSELVDPIESDQDSKFSAGYQRKMRKKASRLIDYFCVIGSNGHLEPKRAQEPYKFQTDILDCYPGQNFYSDLTFPQHVSKFVFPEGCIPYLSEAKPGFFTFVLTLETGERLYGAALHIYEENSKNDFINSFEQLEMVNFYLPKCLTILSHYPLFDTFHALLLQLYHISHSPSNPLPLERYIAHFTREIPLPPPGKIEVIAKLLPQLPQIKISRPSQNELPLFGFSLQPLFSCLSISNVMVLFSCLLSETQVVLCSKYYTLLTPVCEALLGLLFPLVWQGCYIPILPYNMLDILDAPFPFLVGVHSRYLREHPARPHGPVYVDLDDDIVHLGFDEEKFDGVKQLCGRRTPTLPEKEADKLLRVLEEHANNAFLPPVCQQKGRVTYGNFEHMNNNDREPYAMQIDLELADDKREREKILPIVQLAYNQHIVSIHNFGMKSDHSLWKKGNLMRIKSLENDTTLRHLKPTVGFNLYDRSADETPNFSGKQIRLGFLRFFVSILLNYKKYIDKSTDTFDTKSFMKGLNLPNTNQSDFVSSMLSTQMFEKFMDDCILNENKPEIKYFNESIIAKKNRSRTRAALNGKKETPFLSDESGMISKKHYVRVPSSKGLSNHIKGYFFSRFPKLNQNLIGEVKEAFKWEDSDAYMGMTPESTQWATATLSSHLCSKEYVLTGDRSIEWALQALAYKYYDHAKESFFSDVLIQAQEMVLLARYKNLSILDSVVKFQSLIRMQKIRRWYIKLRSVVLRIQQRRKAVKVGSTYTFISSCTIPSENFEVILCD